jgi:L-2-hydroxyglutarate oxidase LhgO
MTDRVECVVVGAGVIGLAVARKLALEGHEVVVLEAADAIGTETSSRNSEVIHAGIYYPKGSLKARLCVAGKQALYDYCRDHGVGAEAIGKLIVATDQDERALLGALRDKGVGNGVDDLEILDAEAAKTLEPALACTGALLSPSTGIVDSHALMLAYQGEAEARGAVIAFLTRFIRGRVVDGGFEIEAGDPRHEVSRLACRILVNAAGLGAQQVARSLEGLAPDLVPRRYLAKGSYFSLAGAAPFRRLIYPVPGSASLGLHYSLDLGGRAKFGPDVEWVEEIDYAVEGSRAALFYEAIRRYYPDLKEGSLQPDYAGVRPKLQAPGEPAADFLIQGPADHRVAGLVNLFGIESPGLTASLAIADHLVELLGRGGNPG